LPFTRPTFAQISARVKTDIQGALEGAAAFFRRSFERAAKEALTGVSHHLHGHIDWVMRQLDPRTADEENLEKIHGEPFGVFRHAAVQAQLTYLATGVDGTVIPAATVFVRADGVRYTSDADATVGDVDTGEIELAITAEEAGADGNCDDGETLSIDAPIAGLDNDGAVVETTTEGSDLETAEDYFERVLARRQDPIAGGSSGDFEQWVLEVAGVTRAWEVARTPGPGAVTVFTVNDTYDDDGLLVSTAALSAPKTTEVAEYLDQPGRQPVTMDVYLPAPTLHELDPEINLSPNTSAVRAAVTTALNEYLLREATPEGMTVLWSQLNEAISLAAGEVDHELVSPAANVTIAYASLPVLGTPVFGSL
jgi:uncharacterized phage protein gp47/JayE